MSTKGTSTVIISNEDKCLEDWKAIRRWRILRRRSEEVSQRRCEYGGTRGLHRRHCSGNNPGCSQSSRKEMSRLGGSKGVKMSPKGLERD